MTEIVEAKADEDKVARRNDGSGFQPNIDSYNPAPCSM